MQVNIILKKKQKVFSRISVHFYLPFTQLQKENKYSNYLQQFENERKIKSNMKIMCLALLIVVCNFMHTISLCNPNKCNERISESKNSHPDYKILNRIS